MCNPRKITARATRQIAEAWRAAIQRTARASGYRHRPRRAHPAARLDAGRTRLGAPSSRPLPPIRAGSWRRRIRPRRPRRPDPLPARHRRTGDQRRAVGLRRGRGIGRAGDGGHRRGDGRGDRGGELLRRRLRRPHPRPGRAGGGRRSPRQEADRKAKQRLPSRTRQEGRTQGRGRASGADSASVHAEAEPDAQARLASRARSAAARS